MNRTLLYIWLSITLALATFALVHKRPVEVPIVTDPVPIQYVGQVKMENVSIRLLVLKHCFESMADGDAKMGIQAANLAAQKGLKISDIGNFYINQDGEASRRGVWKNVEYTADGLKEFISKQMKTNAEPGDTVVVFTIGHGSASGHLATLGERRMVMKAIADAAGENGQETVWWQLSCYACAGLPKITELPENQQDLFSVIASSDASHVSAAYVQGKHMEKVFVAMAENDPRIDPDKDGSMTAKEIGDFMTQAIGENRGSLVFAKSQDEVMFGANSLARLIPIIDRNGTQNKYPKDYIPLPKR